MSDIRAAIEAGTMASFVADLRSVHEQ
jgi:hypothetical protein